MADTGGVLARSKANEALLAPKAQDSKASQGLFDPMEGYSFDMNGRRYRDEIMKENPKYVDYNHDAVAKNKAKYADTVQDVAQMDLQKWLQITLAGFKYQDPMNPKDPGATTAELAQVAGNVGITEMKKTADKMHETMHKSMALGASQNIGQKVEVQSDTFKHTQGEEDKLSFELPHSAHKIKVEIRGKGGFHHQMILTDGEMVKMNGEDVKVDLSMGRHDIYWHGLNSKGVPAESGEYSFQIRTFDKQGKTIVDPETKRPPLIRKYVEGHFGGSVFDAENGNIAMVDGREVPFEKIRRFSEGKKAPLPPSAPPHMLEGRENPENRIFSEESNAKWQRAMRRLNAMEELADKSPQQLAAEVQHRLGRYNVEPARHPQESALLNGKNRASN